MGHPEMSKRVTAVAHGRVNLIGEHTDYNGGFVLPTCIPQSTSVELTLRSDKKVIARSNEYNDELEYQFGQERARRHWSDYIQGVTFILSNSWRKPTARSWNS